MTDILNPLIDEQADYVKGNRFGHPDVFKHMPLVRFLGTATLTRATRWATGYRTLEDSQCGYTAISAATLHRLPLDTLYPRYGFPNDLLIKLAQINGRVSQRTVTPIYGPNTSKMKIRQVIYPLSKILMMAILKRIFDTRSRKAQMRVTADRSEKNADMSPGPLQSTSYADTGS